MSYPSTISSFTNPLASDKLNSPSHSAIEVAQNNELIQIETVVGVDGASSVLGTIIGDLRSPGSSGGGHVQSANKGGTGQTSYSKGDILIASSSSVLSKLSVGADAYILNADSTQSAGVAWISPGISPISRLVTSFETSGRFSTTNTSNGTSAFNTTGLQIGTSATSGSASNVSWQLGNTAALYSAGAVFSCQINTASLPTAGSAYIGLGDVTVDGTGHTFTSSHIGFKLTMASGTVTISATNSAGTETATTLTTGTSTSDCYDLILEIVSTSQINYYYRKNGGALSAVTMHTTNIPTSSATRIQFSISNNSTTSNFILQVLGASYQR